MRPAPCQTTIVLDGPITRETEQFVLVFDGKLAIQRVKRFAEVDEAEGREAVASFLEMTAGKRVPTLVDLRAPASVTGKARAFFASQEGCAGTTRLALLTASNVTALAGNLFMRVNRPPVPTRLFTDEDQARAWLLA